MGEREAEAPAPPSAAADAECDALARHLDTARREAERMRDRYEMMEVRGAAPVYSWEREAAGYANRNGTSASEEPAAPPSADAPRCGEPEHLRYLEALLAAKNKWLKGLPTREEFEGLHQEVRFLREKCGADIAALDAKVVKLGAASITCDALHRNAGTWNTQHDTQIAELRDLALALAEPWYTYSTRDVQSDRIRELTEKVRQT
jgi:hypothetical protein